MLSGKKILLAVTGSIAAYKTAFFVRLLVKSGAQVEVIMTDSATDFITPLTLSTLSKRPVHRNFFEKESGSWDNHVELGLWADLFIVAPASANTIAKMANGICDNLLLATYLSARCPVMIAPAMDLDMMAHPATQSNIDRLKSFGNLIVDAVNGELASGLSGRGRMSEPQDLIAHIESFFNKKESLKGKNILITSGPTREPIDPVRFIGNHSSGKMGAALAKAAADQGAHVQFITGPVSTLPTHPSITIHAVNTADEMLSTTQGLHEQQDIVIFAAAVADYKPAHPSQTKNKRDGKGKAIDLVENPDIAAILGVNKKATQVHLGFALETESGENYAQEKLIKKNFDLIALNSIQSLGVGFGMDTNQVTVFDRKGEVHRSLLKTKTEIAEELIDLIVTKYL
ncbi:MAG: phosphopantothenoylcysteine decarboxylase/phosphopantothenate--cysteine ligase [Cyclobacteriaceae bacterium]|jgi:phosphopantothenoylcysteine decarboxylase/phosphopantothenate--cysteine ligase